MQKKWNGQVVVGDEECTSRSRNVRENEVKRSKRVEDPSSKVSKLGKCTSSDEKREGTLSLCMCSGPALRQATVPGPNGDPACHNESALQAK